MSAIGPHIDDYVGWPVDKKRGITSGGRNGYALTSGIRFWLDVHDRVLRCYPQTSKQQDQAGACLEIPAEAIDDVIAALKRVRDA